MTNFFMKCIDDIYYILKQPIDLQFKKQSINYYKNKLKLNKNQSLREYYLTNVYNAKNNKGAVYTPLDISNFIIRNTIKKEDIIKNPYIKILDPSCGIGNILIPLFIYLKEIYEENIEEINNLNKINLKKYNISQHIIKNNIFGFDIDSVAIKILCIDLFEISKCNCFANIKLEDYLKEDNEKFNIIIGNPPYIGHKDVDKDYFKYLKNRYKTIYKDKSDMSYCFVQQSLWNLEKEGKITFITSRYFLESQSGENLRKILKDMCRLYKIVDFYGIRPFKGVGIDPVIIFLKNENKSDYNIEVIKPENYNNKKEFMNFFKEDVDKKVYKKFYLNKNSLNNKNWILRDKKERRIINKIEEKSFCSLNNICLSYQGIITGCDKAFVVNKDAIKKENLEKDILKTWIKNSYIHKNEIQYKDKYLIYSDDIKNELEYSNSIKHIQPYKKRLENRRECKRGVRKWYELQWGRRKEIFEGKKIVFPFKSSHNKFALDEGSFFSADVYCLVLKENVPFTYEYLLFILNSKVYDFYFKSFSKKLGDNLYEYYPNNLMKICVPLMKNFKYTEEDLLSFFEFNEEEIKIIKEQNN